MAQQTVLTVNGRREPISVEPERTLLSVLRDDLGLTGTKAGCDDSECGACMVLLDGEPVNSCCYLALQADDRAILTVEGLAGEAGLHPLQRAILEQGGAQCGFCTPGVLMSAAALLARNVSPSDTEIREALSGNLCRCTGYQKIVAAVSQAAADLSSVPKDRRGFGAMHKEIPL